MAIMGKKEMIEFLTSKIGKADTTFAVGHLSRFPIATASNRYSDKQYEIKKVGKNQYSITESENPYKF